MQPVSMSEQRLCELEPMLVGDSPAMKGLRQLILKVAPTRASVMLHGETGAGADVVARAIHRVGRQPDGPFVTLSMASIQPGCTEYSLFGRDTNLLRDAAGRDEQGHCEAADGGTLFLDEIAEMEMQAQPKLFRFLQEAKFQRVGSQQERQASVRVIAATHRHPEALVADGYLREDLFFRLSVVPAHVAPLRDRPEDIPAIASYFLRQAATKHERAVTEFADDALLLLQQHDWPGNMRQLENVVERLVVFARGQFIGADDIPIDDQLAAGYAGSNRFSNNRKYPIAGNPVDSNSPLTPIERHERGVIVDALRRADGHVVSAARLLGLGQATMYRKIKQYAIPRERRTRHAK